MRHQGRLGHLIRAWVCSDHGVVSWWVLLRRHDGVCGIEWAVWGECSKASLAMQQPRRCLCLRCRFPAVTAPLILASTSKARPRSLSKHLPEQLHPNPPTTPPFRASYRNVIVTPPPPKNVLSTSLCHAPCRQPTHLHHRQNHLPSPNRRQNQSPHHGFTDPQDQGQEPHRRARRR